MTNNQLTEIPVTDDEILRVLDAFDYRTGIESHEEHIVRCALAELQERRNAAMDSEPVAWRWRWSDDAEGYWRYTEEQRETHGSVTAQPLYRHAQQPVVPEEMNFSAACNFVQINGMAKEDRVTLAMRVWNACRAAILQAQSDDDGEPTDDERIMAIEGIHNCERCGDEGWVVGEMGITRCACGQAGNSPVIGIDLASGPDRTVEIRYVAPPGYVMVPKVPTERMVIDGFESEPDETFSEPEVWEAFQKMSGCEQAAFRARLCWAAMLAAAPQENN